MKIFRIGLVGTVVLLIFTVAYCLWWRGFEYRRHYSPDNKVCLEVRRDIVLFLPPGQAGDAPGWILLKRDNKVIKETRVEMVSLVETPEWSPHHVSVKLILEWDY